MSGRLGRALGAVLVGLRAHVVDVETLISPGLVTWQLVGLPDAAVLESRDRVRAALLASGQSPPQARVTVNLSPASLHKNGTQLDLPVAISVLGAAGVVPAGPADVGYIGELGLDGAVRAVTGVLPLVLGMREAGVRRVVVPRANAAEARLVPGITVHPVASLGAAMLGNGDVDAAADVDRGGDRGAHGQSGVTAPATGAADIRDTTGRAHAADVQVDARPQPDLADVTGQPLGRRVVEVAAAGEHHVLLLGSPGTGKTMLATRLPGLLPTLPDDDALTVTAVHSVCGSLRGAGLVRRPPLEAPHHTASVTAVVGGGTGLARPGAVSRAHAGVLLLDEAPEFPRAVLDAMRQPLEAGEVTLHRARGAVTFPARFQLVMTANPCPCARPANDCECPSTTRRLYQRRLSGPLLDRVDIRVEVPPAVGGPWSVGGEEEDSETVRRRVTAARSAATARWREVGFRRTRDVPGTLLRSALFRPSATAGANLRKALDRGLLSARGADRCLRVAWTLADLAGRAAPSREDLDEALDLRVRT